VRELLDRAGALPGVEQAAVVSSLPLTGYNLGSSLVFEGRRAFVINMDRVTHIDSSGLGALIASSGTVAKVAGRIALVNLTRRVSEVMTITKLLTVFDVPDSETMAVVQLSSPPITH